MVLVPGLGRVGFAELKESLQDLCETYEGNESELDGHQKLAVCMHFNLFGSKRAKCLFQTHVPKVFIVPAKPKWHPTADESAQTFEFKFPNQEERIHFCLEVNHDCVVKGSGCRSEFFGLGLVQSEQVAESLCDRVKELCK